MANLYTPPNGSRVISSFAPGDRIDVVNWPSVPVSIVPAIIPADTLLVMPFFSDYVLNYDSVRFSHDGTTVLTWGLYSYNPSNRSGSLLNTTNSVQVFGTDISDMTFTPGTIYPGRTYAVAVNSSTAWTMSVFSGNGASSSRILGFDWLVPNTQRIWSHLRTPLTYNADLPATLPATLVKSNQIWPPNPLFGAV
jgi:hypothetical protein